MEEVVGSIPTRSTIKPIRRKRASPPVPENPNSGRKNLTADERGWAHRRPLPAFANYQHPQTQGKVERFRGAMAAALKRRGYPKKEERQPWLDEFRHAYNHLRPHEALGMQTPATVWHKSERRYEPNPARWEYEEGSEVVKLAAEGHIRVAGQRWENQSCTGWRMGATDPDRGKDSSAIGLLR